MSTSLGIQTLLEKMTGMRVIHRKSLGIAFAGLHEKVGKSFKPLDGVQRPRFVRQPTFFITHINPLFL